MARLGIDIDGVAYRFVDVLRDYIHTSTGKPLEEMPPANCWDFFKDQWGLSVNEYIRFVNEGVKDKIIFWEGPTYPGCKEVVDYLHELGHEIVFITARSFNGIEDLCARATEHWLESNEIYYDELIISNHKTGFGLDVLFDDSPNQLENQILHGENAVAFTQPWNKDMPVERVNGWAGLLAYVSEHYPFASSVAES